jgi:riboflavin synthase alpha subunit
VVDAGVNIEIDVIARYLDRLMPASTNIRQDESK